MSDPESLPAPDPILLGRLFRQLLLEGPIAKDVARAKAVMAHLAELEESAKLLAQCLPHLRSLETKKLRAQIMQNLTRVKELADAREQLRKD